MTTTPRRSRRIAHPPRKRTRKSAPRPSRRRSATPIELDARPSERWLRQVHRWRELLRSRREAREREELEAFHETALTINDRIDRLERDDGRVS